MSRRSILVGGSLVAVAIGVAALVRDGAPAPEAPVTANPGAAARATGVDGDARESNLAAATRAGLRLASISGRVVDDAGRAAPGAAVLATGAGRFDAVAGEDGRFTLRNLLPGEYVLHASLQLRASDPLGPVPLAAAEELRDVTLVLELGAALSGTVRDARDGSPIAGAGVSAGASGATTGADGKYRLVGLPPGVVRVTATAEGFLPRGSDVELVRGREKTGGDIHLERAGRVHGRVSASELAVAGVEIAAARYALGGRGAELLPVGVTDGDGYFAGAVPPGRVQLVARAAGFAESRSDEFEIRGGEDREVNLSLGAGGGIDGRVRDGAGALASGCRVQAFDAVHGRTLAEGATDGAGQFWLRALPPAVYAVVAVCGTGRGEAGGISVRDGAVANTELTLGSATLAGRVVDGAGKPVAGAVVSVRVDGSAAPETPVGSSGADGAFAAAGLSGSRFTVAAVAPQGRAERGGVEAGSRDVVLTIAASELVGHVEGDRAEPISDFTVYAEPAQIGEGRPRSQRFVSPTGDFRMPLPPGRYSVRAGAPGYGPATVPDVVVSESGGRVRIALTRGGTVRGRVVDTAGQPVAGASVASSFDLLFAYGRTAAVPSGAWTVSDAQGRFELLGVPTGRRTWIFGARDGYQQIEHPSVTPATGQEIADVVVKLKPASNDEREPEFGGVGLTLALRNGAVVVVDAFQGGPGREAGIRPGDQILAVDGRGTMGVPLGDVVSSVRGVVGTTVVLTVRRDGRDFQVPVARATVKL